MVVMTLKQKQEWTKRNPHVPNVTMAGLTPVACPVCSSFGRQNGEHSRNEGCLAGVRKLHAKGA